MTQTITRLYDNYDVALQAVRTLKDAGIPDGDISMIAATESAYDGNTDTAVAEDASTGAGVGGVVGAGATGATTAGAAMDGATMDGAAAAILGAGALHTCVSNAAIGGGDSNAVTENGRSPRGCRISAISRRFPTMTPLRASGTARPV